MPNKRNYAREMLALISSFGTEKPSLLLHACCAPCSSGVLDQLIEHFDITILFYNPNISPESEYQRRNAELERFLDEAYQKGVKLVSADYQANEFFDAVKGLEGEPEGGERCTVCYRLRMEQAASYAAKHSFEWFTTTLSVSPLKDPVRINEIGEALELKYGVKHLPSEFRKRDGYLHSLRMSEKYGLYRQDYCGCIFSKTERDKARIK